ncbi:MAG: tyrosine-type recombinase/integrase [Dehalococcoidia bacterium]
METSTLELKNLIQGFKLSCQTECKSPRTVEWYTSFLDRFHGFLERNNCPADISCLNRNHIRGFIRYLQAEARVPHTGTPLSTATIQAYIRVLKVFFSWAIREEYLRVNPMAPIAMPKSATKIINTFTDEQMAKLTDVCLRSNGNGHRNLTILLLFLDSGLRVSELVGIELDDINLREGYITIRQAKGRKERIIPIGSIVQKSLWKYINLYRPKPLTDNVTSLFLGNSGLSLTRNGVQQMIRRLASRAGITGVRCSPHTFRHTFSKRYLTNGGDIFSLQRILGHSSLATVRIYLNLYACDIKKQHVRFSPVDRLVDSRSISSIIRSGMYSNSNPRT